MAYFELDVAPIRQRCAERGDVAHLRYPIRDFDPFDLRMKLAGAEPYLSRPHRSVPQYVCQCAGRQPGASTILSAVARGGSPGQLSSLVKQTDELMPGWTVRGAGAVQLVADQVKRLRGTGRKVYIHCTAGGCPYRLCTLPFPLGPQTCAAVDVIVQFPSGPSSCVTTPVGHCCTHCPGLPSWLLC